MSALLTGGPGRDQPGASPARRVAAILRRLYGGRQGVANVTLTLGLGAVSAGLVTMPTIAIGGGALVGGLTGALLAEKFNDKVRAGLWGAALGAGAGAGLCALPESLAGFLGLGAGVALSAKARDESHLMARPEARPKAAIGPHTGR